MFSSTGSEPTLPSVLRSAGISARPAATAPAGFRCVRSIGTPWIVSRPAVGLARAVEEVRHLLEAGADQAGEADDLAVVHLERDVAHASARQPVDRHADALLAEVGVAHRRRAPPADGR